MGKATAKTERIVRGTPRIESPRASRPVRVMAAAGTAVRIREALDSDWQRLASLRVQAEELHARLLPDYFRVSPQPGPLPPSSGPGAITLVAERSPRSSTRSTADRADVSSVVLGYVTVKLVETPRDPAMTPRRRAHVETVVVDADHRGRGVGTALMRAAHDWARRHAAAELVLTVWSENHAAEALYERLGYRPIARILRRQVDS